MCLCVCMSSAKTEPIPSNYFPPIQSGGILFLSLSQILFYINLKFMDIYLHNGSFLKIGKISYHLFRNHEIYG